VTGTGSRHQDAKAPLKTRLKANGGYNYRFTALGSYDSFPSAPLGGWGMRGIGAFDFNKDQSVRRA